MKRPFRRLFIYSFFFALGAGAALLMFFDDISIAVGFFYSKTVVYAAIIGVCIGGGLIAVWLVRRVIRIYDKEEIEERGRRMAEASVKRDPGGRKKL